ncbi:MAG: hypothetical protein U0871_11500 [Gemmataceae bacterium]
MRWGLGIDLPAAVSVAGGKYRFQDDQETPDTQVVSYDFADGKTITWEGFSCNTIPYPKPFDVLFQGETGSLAIHGGGYTVFDKKGKEVGKGSGTGGDAGHTGNFVAAVRGTAKLNAPIEVAAASTMLCHLGNIAYRVGRRVLCEPKIGRPSNDPAALKLWTKEYEKGWEPKV